MIYVTGNLNVVLSIREAFFFTFDMRWRNSSGMTRQIYASYQFNYLITKGYFCDLLKEITIRESFKQNSNFKHDIALLWRASI